MRLSLWASHSLTAGRSVVFLSLPSALQSRPPAVSAICPHHISAGCSRSANNPLLVKLPKLQITAHLHSFIPLFSRLWNKLPHTIQSHLPSRPSKQLFITTSYHLPSKSSIFSPPDNPPKPTSFKFPAFLPESPCNVHLLFPMFPIPSLSLPQISSCLFFPTDLSFPLTPLSRAPLLCVVC